LEYRERPVGKRDKNDEVIKVWIRGVPSGWRGPKAFLPSPIIANFVFLPYDF
jgi:hypothetical protein